MPKSKRIKRTGLKTPESKRSSTRVSRTGFPATRRSTIRDKERFVDQFTTTWESLRQLNDAVNTVSDELQQFLEGNGYNGGRKKEVHNDHYYKMHDIILSKKDQMSVEPAVEYNFSKETLSAIDRMSTKLQQRKSKPKNKSQASGFVDSQSRALSSSTLLSIASSSRYDPDHCKKYEDGSYDLKEFHYSVDPNKTVTNPKQIRDIPERLNYSTFQLFLDERTVSEKFGVAKTLLDISLYQKNVKDGCPYEPISGVANEAGWENDVNFGKQRLQGANPLAIRRIPFNNLRELLPIELKGQQKDKILNSFDKTSNLFVLDYSFLNEINDNPNSEMNDETKLPGILPCTYSIFELDAQGNLLPKWIILIRKETRDKKNCLIFKAPGIPTDPNPSNEWKFARKCVQCSDLNVHEIKYHLVQTHLVAEILFVSAFKYLGGGTSAFILKILEPHFRETVSINKAARDTLLPTLARISGSNAEGLVLAITHYFTEYRFETSDPVSDLNDRGFTETNTPAGYHYAHDSRSLWKGLTTLFKSIVDIHYKKDEEVESEERFKCFTAYVRDVGNIDFPEIKTKATLVDVLSKMVYMVSAGHSAVNYLQSYYFGYVGNAPGAIYYDLNRIDVDNEDNPILREDYTYVTSISTRLRNLQSEFVKLLSSAPTRNQTLESIVSSYPEEYDAAKFQFISVCLAEINHAYIQRGSQYDVIIPNRKGKPTTLAGGISI